jgi:hypothetical protein
METNTTTNKDTMTIYYRANGTHFVIDCRDGGAGIFVTQIGAFARALVRRRIGHDSFTLSPA